MITWLIECRKARGLTQKEVSEKVGIAAPTYWAYEHGKIKPTPDTAKRLAAVLGVPWTKFFE